MDTTEKELLDMGEHFKKLLAQRDEKIERLCKTIALAYGLCRCVEEDPECASLCISSLHQYLNLEIEKLMGINE